MSVHVSQHVCSREVHLPRDRGRSRERQQRLPSRIQLGGSVAAAAAPGVGDAPQSPVRGRLIALEVTTPTGRTRCSRTKFDAPEAGLAAAPVSLNAMMCAPHRETRRRVLDGPVDGPHPDATADTLTLSGSRGTNRVQRCCGSSKTKTNTRAARRAECARAAVVGAAAVCNARAHVAAAPPTRGRRRLEARPHRRAVAGAALDERARKR